MKNGDYRFWLHNYSSVRSKKGFSAQIEFEGKTYDFAHDKPVAGRDSIPVATVKLKDNKFSLIGDLKLSTSSKEKWGVNSNTWVKVTNALVSPNYWSQSIGNRSYFFFLENCVSDETPRPFLNEFLKPELDEHRKTMEVVGSKLKIQENPAQLSGLGFSETQRSDILVRVEGSFKRTLRIKF